MSDYTDHEQNVRSIAKHIVTLQQAKDALVAAADHIAKLERELESRPAVPQAVGELLDKWVSKTYENTPTGVAAMRAVVTCTMELAGAIAKAEGDK